MKISRNCSTRALVARILLVALLGAAIPVTTSCYRAHSRQQGRIENRQDRQQGRIENRQNRQQGRIENRQDRLDQGY